MKYGGSGPENCLILASSSPRRRELMREAGFIFEVETADIDESLAEGEEPAAAALRLAEQKALSVSSRHMDRLTVGADTLVAVDDKIFGKPADRAEAENMLRSLSGRTHRVYTGVAVSRGGDILVSFCECTYVTFFSLTGAEIEEFISTKESYDKAGAYAIQGRGALLVKKIDGCYSNVVGLPVSRLARELKALK